MKRNFTIGFSNARIYSNGSSKFSATTGRITVDDRVDQVARAILHKSGRPYGWDSTLFGEYEREGWRVIARAAIQTWEENKVMYAEEFWDWIKVFFFVFAGVAVGVYVAIFAAIGTWFWWMV